MIHPSQKVVLYNDPMDHRDKAVPVYLHMTVVSRTGKPPNVSAASFVMSNGFIQLQHRMTNFLVREPTQPSPFRQMSLC